jgi:predicted nucleic acid-binding protein
MADDPRLGALAGEILDDPDSSLLIPSIALSEALFILERKPSLYKLTEADLLEKIRGDQRMEIVALDWGVVLKTQSCRAITEMHDRQIVATALVAQDAGVDVAILTRDGNITDAGLVPVVW